MTFLWPAYAAELRNVRVVDNGESTRVVLELDEAVVSTQLLLDSPPRFVVDVAGGKRPKALKLPVGDGLVKSVRSGIFENNLRVVFDLVSPVQAVNFELPPNAKSGYRVVFDLSKAEPAPAPAPAPAAIDDSDPVAAFGMPKPESATASVMPAPLDVTPPLLPPVAAPMTYALELPAYATTFVQVEPIVLAALAPTSLPVVHAPVAVKPSADQGLRPELPETPESDQKPDIPLLGKAILIAIDPGHGGEDPGARGINGVIEKEVTLQISKKLAAMVNATPGYRAVLTRTGDYYVGLRDRTNLARNAGADLFVSIHANSLPTARNVRGTAVYVLSQRGATSEHAKMLAKLENAADFIGGIEVGNKDDDLASVLLDIQQTGSREASFNLASRLLNSIGKINNLQKRDVQQAGFAVLKAPNIPSVLVETAFLSQADDESLLADSGFQQTYAKALMQGIVNYFQRYRALTDTPVVKSTGKTRKGSKSPKSPKSP